MRQVAFAECHEETDAFDAFDVQSQRFDFFVVQQIHVLLADLIEIVFAFDFHRFCFDPFAVFPIASVCRNFADVDLRIEVGCERITMIAAVAVQDIDRMDFIEMMFLGIGREYACYARVKA